MECRRSFRFTSVWGKPAFALKEIFKISHHSSLFVCLSLVWVMTSLARFAIDKTKLSLIIHKVKTRKITTVKEVWIPGLISVAFDTFTSPFIPKFLSRLRRYIKHSRQCFIGYSNTLNFVKNTPLRVLFSTLFSVFGYPDEALSLVFDTLHLRFLLSLSFNWEDMSNTYM